MKCPYCHTDVNEQMHECPLCHKEIAAVKQTDAITSRPIQTIYNKAIWEIAKGEIARHISERDFANLDNLSGIIIQDGVTAVIQVNGKELAQINGGLYEFVNDAEVSNLMEQRVTDWKSLRGLAVGGWRSLIKFICGQKVGGQEPFDKREHTIDEIIGYLRQNAIISVYLKIDKHFEAIQTIPIRTKYLDTEIGVQLLMHISDFHTFICEYMRGRASVTVSDICDSLKPYVKNILQNELRDEEFDEFGIRQEVKTRIEERLKNLTDYLYGVTVDRILDLSCNSKDFERFRALSQDLYCNEKELDFLRRTNEFRNRLAAIKTTQELQEAQSELERSKVLDGINKDGLLHQEEMEQFKKTLELSRKETEARNEGMSMKIDAQRMQNMAELVVAKMQSDASLKKQEIRTGADIEDERFAATKRQYGRASEQLDLEQELYGKQQTWQKQQLQDKLEAEDIILHHRNNAAAENADVENSILKKKLDGQAAVDDYAHRRREQDAHFQQQLEDANLESLRKKQEMSLSALERMNRLKDESYDKAHMREMDKVQLLHRERMAAIEKERNETPEQIMARNIGSMNSEAATQFAASLGSKREIELLREQARQTDLYKQILGSKQETELLREQARREADLYKQMLEMQRENTDKMMGFAERSMQTNASLISGDKMQQSDREKQVLNSMERIASRRISEIAEQKEEYREQMKHEQQRTDQNQERALNYTTRVTEIDALHPVGNNKEMTYCIENFGNQVSFSLEQIKAFVAGGIVTPETLVTIQGRKLPAKECAELQPLFKR